jgi:t-SNARE complex subunit (syntaxin)
MISNDEFHRSITEQINNIFRVMNKLHTETTEEIEDLKKEVNDLKSSYNSHVAVSDAIKDIKTKAKMSQKQKIAIVFGVVPIILTIYTLFMNR